MTATTPKKPLRAILIGYGNMGKDWCAILGKHPGAELAGVVEPRAEARERAVAEQGLLENAVYENLADALATANADFIIDCSPPLSHKDNTQLALDKGYHVMGEKPIALTMDDARIIVASAQAANRVYMVNQNYRWHPVVRALREYVASGKLGPLQTVHVLYAQNFTFNDTFRYRMEHPLLLDMAIHHFDMARCITGQDAVSAYSVESRPATTPFKGGSSASTLYTFADGSVFTYQGSWSDTGHATDFMGTWRIVCDNGVITWCGNKAPALESSVLTENECSAFNDRMRVAITSDATAFYGQLQASLDSFIAAVRSSSQPETWCGDNIHTLNMVLGAIESTTTGQRVYLRKTAKDRAAVTPGLVRRQQQNRRIPHVLFSAASLFTRNKAKERLRIR